jgi:RNA polymerase sigma factor (sigma-70 family)
MGRWSYHADYASVFASVRRTVRTILWLRARGFDESRTRAWLLFRENRLRDGAKCWKSRQFDIPLEPPKAAAKPPIRPAAIRIVAVHPLADLLREEGTREVARMVAALPDERQRRVVTMLWQGFSQIEIAHELGLSEGRVSQIKHSAFAWIRANLQWLRAA